MRRNGFTLVETLLAVVVAGILMMMGLPRLQLAVTQSSLKSARGAVAGMYSRARAVAIETNRRTALQVDGNSLLITATPRLVAAAGSSIDTVGVVQDMYAAYRATISATADSIPVDPRGIGAGIGSTLTLSRNGHTRTITISSFGRVN